MYPMIPLQPIFILFYRIANQISDLSLVYREKDLELVDL